MDDWCGVTKVVFWRRQRYNIYVCKCATSLSAYYVLEELHITCPVVWFMIKLNFIIQKIRTEQM